MSEHCFDVSLKLENIGPHSGTAKLNFHQKMSEHRLVVYAPNGAGKTFISRMFRAAMLHSSDSDRYLTKGKSSGSFSFVIDRVQNGVVINHGSVETKLKRGKMISADNQLGMLFHVFNSDYVEGNVRPNNYNPQSNITGYIIGRAQIDISEEKTRAKELEAEIAYVNADIRKRIAEALSELKRLKVSSGTTEYRRITADYLRNLKHKQSEYSFEEIKSKLEALANFPDNLPLIAAPKISVSDSVFLAAKRILSQEYPQAEWDDEFIGNARFIEYGIDIMGNSNCCPYCKQTLGLDAKRLISEYKRFLDEKKGSVHSELEDMLTKLKSITAEITRFIKGTETAERQAVFTAKFFPSTENISLTVPGVVLPNCFQTLNTLIEEKIRNVSISISCEEIVQECVDYLNYLHGVEQYNHRLIDTVNNTKFNLNKERLDLRKMLCRAQAERYSAILADDFDDLQHLEGKLKELKVSIQSKENAARLSRKDCFFDTLEHYLYYFFGNKYTVDRELCEVCFHAEGIGSNARRVLSEGEKNIVAFCYYLASVHLSVSHYSDYSRLMFVIDDPIIGLDSQYISKTAKAIGEIGSHFGIAGKERVWVLTHSKEFVQCLSDENVISDFYELSNGKISKYFK